MENKEYMRTIEINGVKLDVDLRYATERTTYKIGDTVKVLKKTYSDTFESFPGVIIGFDPFINRPTLIVAYLKTSYADASVEFVNITQDSKDIEICPARDVVIPFEQGRVIELMNRAITEAEKKVDDLKLKKEYFISNFNKYFEPKQ